MKRHLPKSYFVRLASDFGLNYMVTIARQSWNRDLSNQNNDAIGNTAIGCTLNFASDVLLNHA